jgi:hypothetical protein
MRISTTNARTTDVVLYALLARMLRSRVAAAVVDHLAYRA